MGATQQPPARTPNTAILTTTPMTLVPFKAPEATSAAATMTVCSTATAATITTGIALKRRPMLLLTTLRDTALALPLTVLPFTVLPLTVLVVTVTILRLTVLVVTA